MQSANGGLKKAIVVAIRQQRVTREETSNWSAWNGCTGEQGKDETGEPDKARDKGTKLKVSDKNRGTRKPAKIIRKKKKRLKQKLLTN